MGNDTVLGTTTAERFRRDGFCFASGALDRALLPGAHEVMDRVVQGEYATGEEPMIVNWRPGGDPTQLVKIDQPQMSDHAVTELLRSSGIGRLAAELTGADMVQAWAVQLLHKPPGGAGNVGNVGWHQDDDYWDTWWDGELFTCWLALSDVTADAGPMRFVPGSHRWGFLASGSFYAIDMQDGRSSYPVPDGQAWREVSAVMPAGSGSFHHRRTIHGSGANTSNGARRSYAVHLRTDRSRPLPALSDLYREQLSDSAISPVLFER